MLFDPFDAVLGTTSKVRLLRALVPLSQPLSGREAARRAGVSHIAQRALEELASIRVLNRDQSGGQYLYTFNREHALAPAIEQMFEAEGRFTDGIIQRLRDVIDRTKNVETAVVFGSAARGEAKPSSDLDVLVLVQSPRARDDMYTALVDASPSLVSAFGVRLSPVVLTVDRFQRQHAEGDPFVAEVLRDARRISGRPIDELIDG
ncbi:MAG: hypothetical protein GEU90_05395 [Gemmatimonas sp.]|nr:hypothetical protein [Gemmatimonas sp.]